MSITFFDSVDTKYSSMLVDLIISLIVQKIKGKPAKFLIFLFGTLLDPPRAGTNAIVFNMNEFTYY